VVSGVQFGGREGMEAEQKKKKIKKSFGTQPKIKPSLGLMSQTPLAHTGDSVGRFRRYQCSTPFNYHSNLSMCGTFLQKAIHIQDNCGLLATPKEIYDLNLSTVTLSIWLSQTPASNFCAKELYNPIFFSSASIPSRQSFRMIVSGLRNLKFGCYATHSQQNRHEP